MVETLLSEGVNIEFYNYVTFYPGITRWEQHLYGNYESWAHGYFRGS
jgi:hypothetical protein